MEVLDATFLIDYLNVVEARADLSWGEVYGTGETTAVGANARTFRRRPRARNQLSLVPGAVFNTPGRTVVKSSIIFSRTSPSTLPSTDSGSRIAVGTRPPLTTRYPRPCTEHEESTGLIDVILGCHIAVPARSRPDSTVRDFAFPPAIGRSTVVRPEGPRTSRSRLAATRLSSHRRRGPSRYWSR